MNKYSFVSLLAIILFSSSLQAQSAPGTITIEGDIPKTIAITPAQIAAMNKISVHTKDMSGKEHDYSGVAVTDILKTAGVIKPEFNRDNLTKYVLVRSSDNYEVLFSMSELDSVFTGRTVILADTVDGSPLPAAKGPYRIIIPGEEKKQARAIFSVTTFIVRNAKD